MCDYYFFLRTQEKTTMPKKSTAVRQSGRTTEFIPWGLGLVGSIGATDNYKIKVVNNSVILPQMASDGGNPFYFGGSQVPHSTSSSRIFAH